MVDEFPKRITKWAEVEALIEDGRLTAAELDLIEKAQTGEPAVRGTSVPTTKSDAVLIRAPLIRYLALGGCKDCVVQAEGVQVAGAWIEGVIDLSFAKAKGQLDLSKCHIAEQPMLLQCEIAALYFNGSKLTAGLNAQGAQFTGDVFLRAMTSDGQIRLSGATIGGELTCEGSTLRNEGGYTLNAEGAQIAGGVFLRKMVSNGQIRLSGTTIEGQLSCLRATLRNEGGYALFGQRSQIAESVFLDEVISDGEIRLSGSTIEGQLSCVGASLQNPGGDALNIQRVTVGDGFYWINVKAAKGWVDLNSAHVGDLVDDTASWANSNQVSLASFTYENIHSPIPLADRLVWLRKGAVFTGEFHPQPYEQLAKVLRESGHKVEARVVLVEKEKAQRRATRQFWRAERKLRRLLRWHSRKPIQAVAEEWKALRIDAPSTSGLAAKVLERFTLFHGTEKKADAAKFANAQLSPYARKLAQQDFRNQQACRAGWLRCLTGAHWAWDWVLRGVVGYGYKPQRSAYVLAALIGFGSILSSQAWDAGDFAPNSDVIIESQTWQSLATDRGTYPNPADTWSKMQAEENALQGRGQDYATFNPIYYAIDTVVPIISIGQEAAWAPSTNRGPWGWWLWFFNPILTLAGWIVTAIGAAAVTGVIRKE